MSDEVKHQPEQGRFIIPLANGEEVLLEYRQQSGVLDFYHTYVPQAARGKGLAEKVVSAGFAFAREKGLKVLPSCSYVAKYVERHPELQELAP